MKPKVWWSTASVWTNIQVYPPLSIAFTTLILRPVLPVRLLSIPASFPGGGRSSGVALRQVFLGPFAGDSRRPFARSSSAPSPTTGTAFYQPFGGRRPPGMLAPSVSIRSCCSEPIIYLFRSGPIIFSLPPFASRERTAQPGCTSDPIIPFDVGAFLHTMFDS